MKVNEIFYSLQGEGHWTGHAAVFIRFSGCNLRCHFCDTIHETGVEMSVEEIVSAATAYPSRHIVITGGEPTLQINAELLNALKQRGCYIQIETNGTVRLSSEILGLIDWVTCSPKYEPIAIDRIDELKMVYQGANDNLTKAEALARKHEARRYLQPCDTGNNDSNKKITEAAIAYIKEHPGWILSLQTHKMLNIR